MVVIPPLVVWRYVIEGPGTQCVMICGITEKLELCADSLDSHDTVSIEIVHSFERSPSNLSKSGIPNEVVFH